MHVTYLLLSSFCVIFVNGVNNTSIFISNPPACDHLNECVSGLLKQYFLEYKGLTYININVEDDELLSAIHSKIEVALVTRNIDKKSSFYHEGYLILSKTAADLLPSFSRLMTEKTWNPYARFLIIITSLQRDLLGLIFNMLLIRRVANVIVMNGTEEAQLYSYNPYDNYGCGRFYRTIIDYGMCSQNTSNLFPDKFVNGLRNCTFKVTVIHRPPFTINPSKINSTRDIALGVEQQLIQLIGRTEGFKVEFDYNYGRTPGYSTITEDMEVIGPLKMLPNNDTDVMIGSIMLVSSRAQAFAVLHGELDYIDDFVFLVKKAPYVKGWRYFYYEFTPTVWCLLFIAFITFLVLMIVTLNTGDKTKTLLIILYSFLGRSIKIKYKFKVKCIIIIWVWFAFLVNNYYSSALVSFMTNPLREYQISTEEELISFDIKPCITTNLITYLMTETNKPYDLLVNDKCNNAIDNIRTVSKSYSQYTIVQKLIYYYNIRNQLDKFGQNSVYCLRKAYGKYLSATFFCKGFPITPKMQSTVFRLRQNGITDKILLDLYIFKLLNMHFTTEGFKIRSSLPWALYITCCILSTLLFVLEILFNYKFKK